jgi:hypothetical protein
MGGPTGAILALPGPEGVPSIYHRQRQRIRNESTVGHCQPKHMRIEPGHGQSVEHEAPLSQARCAFQSNPIFKASSHGLKGRLVSTKL